MPKENFEEEHAKNIEDAREAAEAEKPLRDMARKSGVTPEVKKTLDETAERKGQQIIDEIEDKKSFAGERTVNGLKISMRWNDKLNRYYFSFPELGIDENNAGMYGRRIDIDDAKIAKTVFEQACSIAQNEADPLKIFKEVSKFANSLYED